MLADGICRESDPKEPDPMKTIRYEKDGEGVVTLTFDAPGAPVNTMSSEW